MDYITLSLIFANVLIHTLPFIISFGPNPVSSFGVFQSFFAKSNSAIQDGEYYRLVTANFLHADIIHLAVNMLSLFQVGPAVNSLYKGWGYMIIFLVSGIGGTLFSYFFNRMPSVGASGAIFGLVGALLAYAIIAGDFRVISNIFLIILLNFGISINPTSRIDNWGHLGGLVTGFIAGLVLILARSFKL
jgi:rhomboid protease GluP